MSGLFSSGIVVKIFVVFSKEDANFWNFIFFSFANIWLSILFFRNFNFKYLIFDFRFSKFCFLPDTRATWSTLATVNLIYWFYAGEKDMVRLFMITLILIVLWKCSRENCAKHAMHGQAKWMAKMRSITIMKVKTARKRTIKMSFKCCQSP